MRKHSPQVIVKRHERMSEQRILHMRAYPVAWGFPMDELCYSMWVANLMHLPILPIDSKIFTVSTYISEARNVIHESFLKMDKVNWLVMLDSDVIPPGNFLDKLLSHNKRLVGGWYRKKSDQKPAVYLEHRVKEGGEHEWRGAEEAGRGLEKVTALGAGCLLMHKSTAEALGEKPYNTLYGGEDLQMCLKAQEKGIEVYVDWSVACAHAGVAII